MELPYVEKEVVKESSPVAISLAKHLHSIGAKLYGAFWCSHCVHQKEVIFLSSLVLFELYAVPLKDVNLYYSPELTRKHKTKENRQIEILDEIFEASDFLFIHQ